MSGRPPPQPIRRGLAGDEAGAFQVLEAVMVAVLVFTAILFFTGVGRPTDASEPGGINLAQNAADILDILETRDFGSDTDADGDIDVQDWTTALVRGDPAVLADMDDLISEIVPAGALYSLRLSNGHGTLTLSPGGADRTPHGARVAETFVFPNWNAFTGNLGAATVTYPGEWVDGGTLDAWTDGSASIRCIKAPVGDRAGVVGVGPKAATWLSIWREEAGRVPDGIPYGLWAGYSDAACTTLVGYAYVGLPGKSSLDPLFPIYGLQLAVWFGA